MLMNESAARRTVYGPRAVVGLIVPSVNVNCEPEFFRMLPQGVSFHTARTISEGAVSNAHYEAMAAGTREAARQLATTAPDLVVYACTSGSLVCDRERIKAEMAQDCGAPVTTTADAVLEALRALGTRKVALATPYLPFVVQKEVEFLEAAGCSVVSERSLGLGRNFDEKLQLQRTPRATIERIAIEADHRDADLIFVSCTGLAALDVIEPLEEVTGKPVITSNQVTAWHCLRMLGIADQPAGFGRLFSMH